MATRSREVRASGELSTSHLMRMMDAVLFQSSKMKQCKVAPLSNHALPQPRFRRALVTGGSRGLGRHVSRALLSCGVVSELVSASRSRPSETSEDPKNLSHMTLDLESKDSIRAFARDLEEVLDLVVLNAGVSSGRPSARHAALDQSFACNVLGNYELVKELQKAKKLTPNARVVVVTGDIYISERDVTVGPSGRAKRLDATRCYSQSKLGLNWWALGLKERFPELSVALVHPGVVNTELMVANDQPLVRWVKAALLLAEEEGAFAVVAACAAPSLPTTYLKNTTGWARFAPSDPSAAPKPGFWELLERLSESPPGARL